MQAFETERLIMRPLSSKDEDFYIYQYTDEQMMSLIDKPLTKHQAQSAFQKALKANKLDKYSVLVWSIFNKHDNEIIGTQALSWNKPYLPVKPSPFPINQAEIGMMLATKIQRKGFGKEALSALMEYGFHYLQLDRINTFHANNHQGSRGLVSSIGFVLEEKLQSKQSNSIYLYFDKEMWGKRNFITNLL